MTIHYNTTKFTAYPSSIVNLLSITLLDQCAFFSGASSQGGLYKCELSTKTVSQAVCNSTLPCSREVNQVCALNGKVVYTDTKAGKVMQYNPDDNSVRALVGIKVATTVLPMGHKIHAHSNKSRGYAP